MNTKGFNEEIVNKNGMGFTSLQAQNGPKLRKNPIVQTGALGKFTGTQPYWTDVYKLAKEAVRYGILPIVDGEYKFMQSDRNNSEFMDAYYIDVVFFNGLLNDMRRMVDIWEEHDDFLQEREELIELMTSYRRSINRFNKVPYKAQSLEAIDEVYPEFASAIREHKSIVTVFTSLYEMDKENGTVHSAVLKEMDDINWTMSSLLFLDKR